MFRKVEKFLFQFKTFDINYEFSFGNWILKEYIPHVFTRIFALNEKMQHPRAGEGGKQGCDTNI